MKYLTNQNIYIYKTHKITNLLFYLFKFFWNFTQILDRLKWILDVNVKHDEC